MSAGAPKYVERVARLPKVFRVLAAHPEGVTLAQLAQEVDVPEATLREDILAFYTADLPPDMLGMCRPDVLLFADEEGYDDVDPTQATRIRLMDNPADELGVEHVDASELALLYTAAIALLDLEPDDEDLAAAVAVLEETMLGVGAAGSIASRPGMSSVRDVLRSAQSSQRKVRVTYSREWVIGVGDRVIEPYRLVQTRRGWEVDAGPLDERGLARTFLLSNIRDAVITDETFELPADIDALLESQRATTTVQVQLPADARWAADMYAERVEVVDEPEGSVVLDVDLLPPLKHRLGLMLLAAGEGAAVIAPTELSSARSDLAQTLLEHHQRFSQTSPIA